MRITVNAAAKVNLFLDIISRRSNGYHNLFMIMQSVDLFDRVTVSESKQSGIFITCSDNSIPCGKENTAFKAAERFFEAAGITGRGARIDIEKNIPHAAGLAGGSADAAAVLYSLNKLFDTGYDIEELCRIGVKTGADVPFCLTGGTRLAQNIGEIISPLPPFPDYRFVLAKPDLSVSTKEAYEAFDNKKYVIHPDNDAALFAAASGDYDALCSMSQNVFEQFIEVPERVAVKTEMRKNNCKCCQMSGSGPTVFGIFENESDAFLCAENLKRSIDSVFVCRPVKKGIIEDT
ncbi:MAG: 4-(cytidine 5'-diphospho)-2-C-methyl-D-erythritol kinase [Clostridiales bacterium]|nr:4-(cytidine 5'-diphospho)-2-C-methyl-D-erythritol kinase [Clostridiales bacterium]